MTMITEKNEPSAVEWPKFKRLTITLLRPSTYRLRTRSMWLLYTYTLNQIQRL